MSRSPKDTASPIRLVRRTKGCELRTEDGVTVATLSWMDAAKLLFHLKDEIRKSAIGRRCIDNVHHLRSGNYLPRGRD